MDKELAIPEIATREKNFFNGKIADFTSDEVWKYFSELQGLAMGIEVDVQRLRGISRDKLLRMVFSRVYNFVISFHAQSHGSSGLEYRLFDKNHDIYNEVFEACFFMSLCMFLYDTKRIKGMSLRKFIYEHSPQKYSVKGSPNYFDYEEKPREFLESSSDKPEKSSDSILREEAALRQYRKRLLKNRPVYQHSSEWSAIRKISEYEWTLYFFGRKDDLVDVRMDEETKQAIKERQKKQSEILSTLKRFRNLYNEIDAALNSPMDKEYIERLDVAAKKFCSKLEKIQYERYIELEKFLVDHIQRNVDFYGINLYRLEKEMKLYRITTDVNRLLCCNNKLQAESIVHKAMLAGNIVFPKLYEYFSNLPSGDLSQIYTHTFLSFMDEVVQSSRLVIDKFVEDGVFGEDWDQLFLKTTNELAEAVLYDSAVINYSITPESQREFQIYLLQPIDRQIRYAKHQFLMKTPFSEPDDDI